MIFVLVFVQYSKRGTISPGISHFLGSFLQGDGGGGKWLVGGNRD